jgi:hypothetical protein
MGCTVAETGAVHLEVSTSSEGVFARLHRRVRAR